MGWGSSQWGSHPWGSGGGDSATIAPVITPLDPLVDAVGVPQSRPLTIRISDDVGVSPSRTRVSVSGVIWVLGGVAVNGATLETTPNTNHGFDLVITPPAPYPVGSVQEVLVLAEDTDGNVATLTYVFKVGIGLRLLSVTNPFENVLLAYFNQPMLADENFLSPANWLIDPVSAGAAPLEIVAVQQQASQANVANLRYAGGGSIYSLTAFNLLSAGGDPLEQGYNIVNFEILFGDQPTPTIRLFNSIFGPLGISQRVRTRRAIDDHVANRALASALDEQFRLRMQRLDGTAGRDGREGKRRL